MAVRFVLSRKQQLHALFLALVVIVPSIVQIRHLSHVRAQQQRHETKTGASRDSEQPHWLVASYYNTQNGMTATLLLNNKGIRPLEVLPTLYNMAGQELALPPVIVEPSSHRFINLSDWASIGGESFGRGSIKLFHYGKDLVLGAQIYLVDEGHSLSFEEKLSELGKFDSRRLEAVWTMPSSKTSVKFALTNTTNAPISVTARLTRSPHITNDPQVFDLQPRETRLLDLCSDFAAGENAQYGEALALSLEHSGTKEALLARAFISEVERGYSNVAQFSNPTLGKSKTYHGAGLRLGTIAGEHLLPVAVVRNTNNQPASLNVRVPYTRTDGTTGIVILPRTRLQPNGIKILDMRQVVRRGEAEPIQIAGLEIEYDSPAGSVIVSAHSESMNRNQVFRVPMWDVLAQRSPTGGYPWHIEETSTTKAYIKNATDREQDYVAFLLYENSSRYMLGTKTVAAHQTIEIDVETLRNNQVPDAFGITIPLHVSSGQLQWTLSRRHDPERSEDEFDRLALVGRSEQVDVTKGISSNYACQNCCGGTFLNGRIEPDEVGFTAEDVVQFQAYREGQTCYEDTYPIPHYPTNWESTNPAVVSIGSNTGIATMHGIGVAKIKASWQEERSFETDPCGGGGYLTTDETRAISETPQETKRIERLLPDCGSCFSFNVTTSPEADLSVKPKVTVTQAGFTGDYLINRWTDGIAIDSPDGSSPTWRQINNPNSPVAYSKGANPTLFATFNISPSAPSTNAKIRAKKGSTVIATKDVTIVGDSVSINGITTTSASEATVKSTSPTFLWEISYDNGSHWSSMGVSGPHTMYWTYAAPLGPPFKDDSGFTYSALYDLALQKACGYAKRSVRSRNHRWQC